ncbi:hypothetical protein KIN20_028126 [Parelaphostrongylus tenuis]|uniref:Uncharacterized protein n=1 Tax=Parelaphostrongylus tenuis TaxID=148309 RepID=A0AAD5R0L1_PARTN|nr:hypothetical protein KIN20_028126 [Parelaphostrongylus tenuis]
MAFNEPQQAKKVEKKSERKQDKGNAQLRERGLIPSITKCMLKAWIVLEHRGVDCRSAAAISPSWLAMQPRSLQHVARLPGGGARFTA